jgi:acyl transferase domain-containing protein
MNTISRFADAFTLLADSGLDPLAAANITELSAAIVAKSRSVTIDTPPEQIVAIVNLVEDLETLLDRLSAEHQAAHPVDTINTGTADVDA